MYIGAEQLNLLKTAIQFGLVSCIIAFIWAPALTKFLYKYNIVRHAEYDATLAMGARRSKRGVPVMGGLLVIVTVAVITYLFIFPIQTRKTNSEQKNLVFLRAETS